MANGDTGTPPDRQIGGEWYTWVPYPNGSGGRMVAYSEVGITPPDDPLADLSGQEQADYAEFMRLLYEADALTPEQRADYERNTGITPPASVNPVNEPAPAPVEPAPSDNQLYLDFMRQLREAGALTPEQEEAYDRNTGAIQDPGEQALVRNNPYDFADWQTPLMEAGDTQRLGMSTGGPEGSYGGGAVWNQVIPQSESPVNVPGTTRPYQAGIDPNFGSTPFEIPESPVTGYRNFMSDLYRSGGLTPEQATAYEQNTGLLNSQKNPVYGTQRAANYGPGIGTDTGQPWTNLRNTGNGVPT